MHYSRLELYRYLKSFSSKQENEQIREHIQNCSRCRALLQEIDTQDKKLNHPDIMIYPFKEHEKPENLKYKKRKTRINPWLKFLPNIIVAITLILSLGVFLSVFFKHR